MPLIDLAEIPSFAFSSRVKRQSAVHQASGACSSQPVAGLRFSTAVCALPRTAALDPSTAITFNCWVPRSIPSRIGDEMGDLPFPLGFAAADLPLNHSAAACGLVSNRRNPAMTMPAPMVHINAHKAKNTTGPRLSKVQPKSEPARSRAMLGIVTCRIA